MAEVDGRIILKWILKEEESCVRKVIWDEMEWIYLAGGRENWLAARKR